MIRKHNNALESDFASLAVQSEAVIPPRKGGLTAIMGFLMLSQKPINWQIAESKYLDLLANMARDLGYKNLLQTDISRYYSPVAHGNQFEINDKIQTEWLRVLENFRKPWLAPPALRHLCLILAPLSFVMLRVFIMPSRSVKIDCSIYSPLFRDC